MQEKETIYKKEITVEYLHILLPKVQRTKRGTKIKTIWCNPDISASGNTDTSNFKSPLVSKHQTVY